MQRAMDLKKHNTILTEIIRTFLNIDIAPLSADLVDKSITVTVVAPAETGGLYRAVLSPSPPATPSSSGGAKRRPAPARKAVGRRPSPTAKQSAGLFDEHEEYCDRYDNQPEAMFASKADRYLCIARMGLKQYASTLAAVVRPRDLILRQQFCDWEMRLLGLNGYMKVGASRDDVDMMRKGQMIYLRTTRPDLKEGVLTPLLQYLPLEEIFSDFREATEPRWAVTKRSGRNLVVRRCGPFEWEADVEWPTLVADLAVALQDYCTARFRALFRAAYGDNVYREEFTSVAELKSLFANVGKSYDCCRVDAALCSALAPVADGGRVRETRPFAFVAQLSTEEDRRAALEALFDDVPRSVDFGIINE